VSRTVPRKTTREQKWVLLIFIIGGALLVTVAVLVPALAVLAKPGGMLLGTGLAVALLWLGAWRWR
jgi:K+ transporter